MEMTKWFDTNYHYIVPEFEEGMTFRLHSTKPVDEYLEAKQLGIQTRPVLLGPVSFVLLGKFSQGKGSREAVLDAIVPVYREVLEQLHRAGAEWVQIDEPCLVLDLDPSVQELYRVTYRELLKAGKVADVLLATYFGAIGSNLETATSLPINGLHIDMVRAPDQLDAALKAFPSHMRLSLGVLDGTQHLAGRSANRAGLRSACVPSIEE